MNRTGLCILSVLLFSACNKGNGSHTASDSNQQILTSDVSTGDFSWESGVTPQPIAPVKVSNPKSKDTGLTLTGDGDAVILSGTATGESPNGFLGSLGFNVDGRQELYLQTNAGDSAKQSLEKLAEICKQYDLPFLFEISDLEGGAARMKISRAEGNDGKSYGWIIPESVNVLQSAPGTLTITGFTQNWGWEKFAKSSVNGRSITVMIQAYTEEAVGHGEGTQEFFLDLTPPAEKTVLKGEYQVIVKNIGGIIIYEGSVVID